MRVYLSGGMRSSWQNKLTQEFHTIKFLDPRNHGLNEEDQYTVAGMLMIQQCDVLFAYLEEDNPSGFGLVAEVGYAKGLGKTVILVDEKFKGTERYFAIVLEMADVAFMSLEPAMDFLYSLESALS